ncbi:hypothetical protein [Bacillus solitudinis]|uniref:hypothetical protein n=1 Tax=Bacillus solitudinis TaxID=2014074 RepID=UPI000C23649A|nr:hypothetical protein [Bacillus solitudinis]
MSSFVLELDTTPPVIEIVAPTYTVSDAETEIIVDSNEILAEYQDIHIVDSSGKRHDVIFLYQGDYFYGKLIFNEFSIGIATIYVRVKDEVSNLSDLAKKTIDIKKSARLSLEVEEAVRSLTTSKASLKVIGDRRSRKLTTNGRERNVSVAHSVRKVEVRKE